MKTLSSLFALSALVIAFDSEAAGSSQSSDAAGNSQNSAASTSSQNSDATGNSQHSAASNSSQNADATGNSQNSAASNSSQNSDATGNSQHSEAKGSSQNADASGNSQNSAASNSSQNSDATGNSQHSEAKGSSHAILQLYGTVPVACTIAVTPTAKATSLDIKGGEFGTKVANVVEDCNSGAGYTVTISSQNSGFLQTDPNNPSKASVGYAFAYSDGIFGKNQLVATRAHDMWNYSNNLTVNVPGNSHAIAGNYSDVLTLVIAAK